MALVTGVVYPNNGDRIKVENYNDPIQRMLAQINGNLDDANITSLSGTKISAGTIPATAFDSTAMAGWRALSVTPTVATGYNKGNKEFDLTFAATDLTSILSPGMRLKVTRVTTPPTQCTDLESGSSQYANKAAPSGISFTDDFTCEAWVKLESYTLGAILSRFTTQGFIFGVNANGQLFVQGTSGANTDSATSYQSLPLDKWVHVAATLDMSGAVSTMYINGVSVPVTYTNGAGSALTQAGDLQVGAYNGATSPFDGKIADVRLWSVVRTATQIRDNMNQQLVGNESNLVAYFKLNGNFNDSTANANNLTGQNSAVATNVDNPMNSTEYAIITKVAFSTDTTVTVFTGTDYNIPNMTLSGPSYSTHKAPFGFNPSRGKWRLEYQNLARSSVAAASTSVWYNANDKITVPLGSWLIGYSGSVAATAAATAFVGAHITMSTANNSESDRRLSRVSPLVSSNTTETDGMVSAEAPVHLTAQTDYFANGSPIAASSTIFFGRSGGAFYMYAECAYL